MPAWVAQVVDAGQGQPLVDGIGVEHRLDLDHLGPQRRHHLDGPLADGQYLGVDLGVAQRRRPRHLAGRLGVIERWPSTTPRAAAGTAGRSDRGLPPRRARPPRRPDGGPSGPGSRGVANPVVPHHQSVPARARASRRRAHSTMTGILIDPPPSEPVASGTMPGGDGRGAPARRPAGRVVEVPRVERRAEHGVVGIRLPPQLRGVGLPHHHAARQPPAGPPVAESAADTGPSANAGEPWVVTKPAASSRSFTPSGMPASGPGSTPAATFRSISGGSRPGPLLVHGHERIEPRVVLG